MNSYGVTIQMKPLQLYSTIYLVCSSTFESVDNPETSW